MQGGDDAALAMPPPPPKKAMQGSGLTTAQSGMLSGENGLDPMQKPREFLTSVFDTIVATDKEGYFLRPVDESVAPGYYKAIQHPLCFADMREKLKAGTYTGYRSMMADFELIVSNARSFNKEKTKCHKCALTLQRNYNRIMSAHELGIRKAFSVLYPQGAPTPAPPTGALASTRTASAVNLLEGSDLTSLATSSAQGTGGQQGEPGADVRDQAVSNAQPPIKAEPSPPPIAAAGPSPSLPIPPHKGKRPAALLPLPPLPPPAPIRLERICKAYSDDEAEGERLVLQYHRQLPEGPASSHRRKQMPLETLLAEVRQGAVFQPYKDPQPQQQQSAPNQEPNQPAQLADGAAAAVAPPPPPASSGQQGEGTTALGDTATVSASTRHRSEDWKQARRSIEWQCKWLELRMQELQTQIQRLAGDDSADGTPGATQSQQPAADGGGGSSSNVTAGLQDKQKRLRTSVSRHTQGGPVLPLLPSSAPHSKLHLPVTHRPLASITFFAGSKPNTGIAATSRAAADQPSTGAPASQDAEMHDVTAPASQSAGATAAGPSTAPPAAAGTGQQGTGHAEVLLPPGMPGFGSVPGSQVPAAVFSALETLELQLLDVKRGLQVAFGLDRGRLRPGAARTGAMSVLSNAAAGAMAGGLGPGATSNLLRRQGSVRPVPAVRAPSTALGSGAAFGSTFNKTGGDAAGKRKRDGEEGAAGGLLAARAWDRPQAIVIPPIRDLSPEELLAREEAGTVWREAIRTQGDTALHNPPPLVAMALAACDDEGSSSEDTSDEAYARMHAIMAEEERKRFAAAAEGQRRRNKQGKTAAAANAAHAAQAGAAAGGGGAQGDKGQGQGAPTRRPSYGIKTPRAASNAAQIPISPHVGAGGNQGLNGGDAADGTPGTGVAVTASFAVPQLPPKSRPSATPGSTNASHAPHLRVPPIVTGIPHSIPSVVLVSATTPTSTPAVATAPHPFRHTTSSLLPSLSVVPASCLPSQPSTGAPTTQPSVPSQSATRPSSQVDAHAPTPSPAGSAPSAPNQPNSTGNATTPRDNSTAPSTTTTGNAASGNPAASTLHNASGSAAEAPGAPMLIVLPSLPRRVSSRRPSTTPVPQPTPSPAPSTSSGGAVGDAAAPPSRARNTRASAAAAAAAANTDGNGANGNDAGSGSDDDDDDGEYQSASGAEGSSSGQEEGSSSAGGEAEEEEEVLPPEEEEEGEEVSGSDGSEAGEGEEVEGVSGSSSAGGSDADSEVSDDEDEDEEDDQGQDDSTSSGAERKQLKIAARKRTSSSGVSVGARKESGLSRRSSGGGKAGGGAAANGSSGRNGKRVSELGKLPTRLTRSHDVGKLRSGSSRDQRETRRGTALVTGGVAKPSRSRR